MRTRTRTLSLAATLTTLLTAGLLMAAPPDPGRPTLQTPPPEPLTGDVNQDGIVDVRDLIETILNWGACPEIPDPCAADSTGDGAVDADDLMAVTEQWGSTNPKNDFRP